VILNDLVVLEPGSSPSAAKLTKALAVVASVLHPAYDALLPTKDKSKESCVLCSLTVRDFLWKIGFKDARVTTVYLALRAVDAQGNEVHSAGVGDHLSGRVPLAPSAGRPREERGYWNGHMVVEVPSEATLIDCTLFPMRRPAWPKLPGMIAAPIFEGPPSFGMEHISAIAIDQENGNMLNMWWVREPNERWRDGGDAKDRALRLPVVRALRSAFGKWS
jgi:hypothetical protein